MLTFTSDKIGAEKHQEYANNHMELTQFLKTHIQGVSQNKRGKKIASSPSNGFTAETLAQILADGTVAAAAETYQGNVESGQKLTNVHFLALTKVRNDTAQGPACLLPENPLCTEQSGDLSVDTAVDVPITSGPNDVDVPITSGRNDNGVPTAPAKMGCCIVM